MKLTIQCIQVICNGENIFVIIFCTSTSKGGHFLFRRFFDNFKKKNPWESLNILKKPVENLGRCSTFFSAEKNKTNTKDLESGLLIISEKYRRTEIPHVLRNCIVKKSKYFRYLIEKWSKRNRGKRFSRGKNYRNNEKMLQINYRRSKTRESLTVSMASTKSERFN